MRLKCGYGLDLEQAQADGQISTEDADELRHFAEFLKATADTPRPSPRWLEIYAEFYPEDYAQAIAERDASNTTDSGVSTTPAPSSDGIPSPVNRDPK